MSSSDSSSQIKAYKYTGVDIKVIENEPEGKDIEENCKEESLSYEGDLYCNVRLPISSSGKQNVGDDDDMMVNKI